MNIKEMLKTALEGKRFKAAFYGGISSVVIFCTGIIGAKLGLPPDMTMLVAEQAVFMVTTMITVYIFGQTVSDTVGKGKEEAVKAKVEAETKLQEVKLEVIRATNSQLPTFKGD